MPGSKTSTHPKKIDRCPWPGIANPEYARYHDEEWGVPQGNSQALFEKLILEGFQAGLSWLTILKKRAAFRTAFSDFDPEAIARFTSSDVERLMGNTGIIRNRAKIEASISNARAYLAIAEKRDFAGFLWNLLEDGPATSTHRTLASVPARTGQSDLLSRALKREGFRFVGPTTLYAFMQSTGMINDHLLDCPRHAPCAALQRAFVVPA